MTVKRYELNEAQWKRIAPLLPGKASYPGRTGALEDGASALQPLVPWRRLGARVRRADRRPR